MSRLVKWWPRDRRQAQAGATLVELLVSLVVIGLALVLIVGAFSSGLLQSSIAKRNTARAAIVQYELDQISGGAYSGSAQSYSDCFATEDATSPPTTVGSFRGACPAATYVLRADVSVAPGPAPNSQMWSVAVTIWPGSAPVGSTVQIVKVNR